MNWLILITVLLGIESPGELPKDPAVKTPVYSALERSLEAKPELLAWHRGYYHYLQQHPHLVPLEKQWLGISQFPTYRSAYEPFDEALHADLTAQRYFDRFYDELARNGSVQATVERLKETEFQQRARPEETLPGLQALRSDPAKALEYLDANSVAESPDAVRMLLRSFKDTPALQQQFKDVFQELSGSPAVREQLLPWWQYTEGFDRRFQGANQRLMGYFQDRPHHFWPWHERNLALTADVQARDWMRYWTRRVRRERELNQAYPGYLYYMLKNPDQAVQQEAEWTKQFGAPQAWPPKTAPPLLQAWTPAQIADRMTPFEKAKRRPEIQHPQRPQRPTRPSVKFRSQIRSRNSGESDAGKVYKEQWFQENTR